MHYVKESFFKIGMEFRIAPGVFHFAHFMCIAKHTRATARFQTHLHTIVHFLYPSNALHIDDFAIIRFEKNRTGFHHAFHKNIALYGLHQ